MVMRVRFGSSLWVLILHTTLEWVILFLQSVEMSSYDEEGIGVKDTLTYVIGAGSNALAQAAKFVGVGSVQGVRVLGFLACLVVLELFA